MRPLTRWDPARCEPSVPHNNTWCNGGISRNSPNTTLYDEVWYSHFLYITKYSAMYQRYVVITTLVSSSSDKWEALQSDLKNSGVFHEKLCKQKHYIWDAEMLSEVPPTSPVFLEQQRLTLDGSSSTPEESSSLKMSFFQSKCASANTHKHILRIRL